MATYSGSRWPTGIGLEKGRLIPLKRFAGSGSESSLMIGPRPSRTMLFCLLPFVFVQAEDGLVPVDAVLALGVAHGPPAPGGDVRAGVHALKSPSSSS